MELTTRLLADAAQRSPDGKLHVLGGEWDRLIAPAFPTTHPSLAVVLVLRVEYGEALRRHELHVDLMKDGELKGVGAVGHIDVGHPPGLTYGASQSASVALTFAFVTFETPGRYEWVVTVDGEPMGALPLEVVEASQVRGYQPLPGTH
jgi:hypothetical protein